LWFLFFQTKKKKERERETNTREKKLKKKMTDNIEWKTAPEEEEEDIVVDDDHDSRLRKEMEKPPPLLVDSKYITAHLDTARGLDDTYHPALFNPTPEMLESRLATERVEGFDTNLDAVARIGMMNGSELNAVYTNVVRIIQESGECPDNTLDMLTEDILKYPLYRRLAPIKRAVVIYGLWLFPSVREMFCEGVVGGGTRHEMIDAESMKLFVDTGLTKAIDPLTKNMKTPHQMVDSVMEMVEEGGVAGYLRRSLHG